MPSEDTRQVLDRHMNAVDSGDLDTILADYAADAAVLTADGTLRGHAQIRSLWEKLLARVFTTDARFTMIHQAVEGEVAFIGWSAESQHVRIAMAADTYLVRGGKIVAQTYAAAEEEK